MQDEPSFNEETMRTLLRRVGQRWQTDVHPQVERALRTLPERDEHVLHLSWYQQLPDSAIASLLDVKGGEEAVAARRRAAVRRLADGDWAPDLTPDAVEAMLRAAGEAWRRSTSMPLSEDEQETAMQAMVRAHRERRSLPSRASAALEKRDASEKAGENPVGSRSAEDRPARRSRRLSSWHASVRTGLTVFLVALMAYGVLWVSGRAARPDTYALASIEAFDENLRTAVRGTDATSDAHEAFASGAAALRDAPTSTWGLFPHYDDDAARRAVESLKRAFASADDPFRRARAAFFLGKAYLMLDNPTAARWWLQRAVEQDVAAYRDDAQALLRDLESQQ